MNIKISKLNICLLLSFIAYNASTINASHSVHLTEVMAMSKVQKETLVTKLITDFLDVAGHPHKSFKDFAHDFIVILKSEENQDNKEFSKALDQIKDKKLPRIIALTLLKYKHLLPKQALDVLKKKKDNELIDILEKRVKNN